MNNHMDNRPDGNRPNRKPPVNPGFFDLSVDFAGMLKFCDRYDERFVQ